MVGILNTKEYQELCTMSLTHCCWLFGDIEAKKSSFAKQFIDWAHLSHSLSLHGSSKAHLRAVIVFHAFAAGSPSN